MKTHSHIFGTLATLALCLIIPACGGGGGNSGGGGGGDNGGGGGGETSSGSSESSDSVSGSDSNTGTDTESTPSAPTPDLSDIFLNMYSRATLSISCGNFKGNFTMTRSGNGTVNLTSVDNMTITYSNASLTSRFSGDVKWHQENGYFIYFDGKLSNVTYTKDGVTSKPTGVEIYIALRLRDPTLTSQTRVDGTVPSGSVIILTAPPSSSSQNPPLTRLADGSYTITYSH